MKILTVIPTYPNYSGVDFHRLVVQHRRIGEHFPECELSQINEIDTATIEFLQGFDLIVANRFLSKINKEDSLIEKLKFADIPYVIDLDDDYKIPSWHILYKASSIGKHAERIIKGIKHASGVTCTHDQLADILKKESRQKSIFIVPNGIYPEAYNQFMPNPFPSPIVTFGWSGSVTHFEDVALMHDALYYLYGAEQYKGKFRVVYGGHEPKDIESNSILGLLSCKGKAPIDQFFTYPSMSVKEYAKFYDLCNVSLIPLRDNRFNNLKSNLKLIESGFKKKAVIVSDVHPYSPMLKHGENCLVVKHQNDWRKHMERLINEPDLISYLANNLYRDVQVQHIDNVAIKRYEAYKIIMEERAAKRLEITGA